jgi:hypothetical protein
MSKKHEETALATVEETTAALVGADMFAADGDSGFEGTGQSDYAIPFLQILQALSPQCTDGDPQYREELRPGMFYNSVTQEAYSGKTGVLFVPSLYRRVGTLWTPRSAGGGFHGSVDSAELEALFAECSQDENFNQVTPDGLHLLDTREWYGLLLDEDMTTFAPVLLSLSKTQLKKSKRWLTLAQGLRVQGRPVKLWSQVYRLTTVPEKNDKGSWAGLEVKHVGNVPSMTLFGEAQRFRDMIRSGAVKAQQPAEMEPFNDQF